MEGISEFELRYPLSPFSFFTWTYLYFTYFTGDGSKEGTKEMIVNSLMMSLGLTRDELTKKMESLVGDGVYQLTEHRVDGGGSLSTVEMLRQEFNLDSGIISSHWDLAHLLELSVNSTIGKDKNFNKVCEFLCEYLKTYKNDKKGMLFKEASDKYWGLRGDFVRRLLLVKGCKSTKS